MAEREGYDDGNDAIVGGVLVPGKIQGAFTLHAELLSDRLFAALWPTVFANVLRAYDLVKAPTEDVAGAATVATWYAVDEILASRMERHAAARLRNLGGTEEPAE